MNDVLKTYPSVALARMAAELACERVYSDLELAKCILIRPRGNVHPDANSASGEYYRIIDRLSRGEKP